MHHQLCASGYMHTHMYIYVCMYERDEASIYVCQHRRKSQCLRNKVMTNQETGKTAVDQRPK